MFTFPSLEWFQELARLMNEDPEPFRRFGYADVEWAGALQISPLPELCRYQMGLRNPGHDARADDPFVSLRV